MLRKRLRVQQGGEGAADDTAREQGRDGDGEDEVAVERGNAVEAELGRERGADTGR